MRVNFQAISSIWELACIGSLILGTIYYFIYILSLKLEFLAVSYNLFFIIAPISLSMEFLQDTSYGKLPSYFAVFGIILIITSPLISDFVIITDYIVIIEAVIFILGISSFISATFFNSLLCLYYICSKSLTASFRLRNIKLITTGKVTISIIYIISVISIVSSSIKLQEIINLVEIDIEYYYKTLFAQFRQALVFLYIQVGIIIIHYGLNKLKFKSLLDNIFRRIITLILIFNFIVFIISLVLLCIQCQ